MLILSHDVFNERRHHGGAHAPTAAGRVRLTLELAHRHLRKHSWVKIGYIRTLAVERIGKRLGRAAPEELTQVIDGLLEIIGACPN